MVRVCVCVTGESWDTVHYERESGLAVQTELQLQRQRPIPPNG